MNRKLYEESMRRLARIGLAFLIACVALTAILCAGNAASCAWSKTLDGPFKLMPVLPYFAFAGGLGFAYVGFAFLNRRCDSDFYHSLPVRRVDQYLAVTLAALTWTVATVVLSVLATAVAYLFLNVPFVPQYLLRGVPFFIVATMLVFAAAAIACSITGTFFSNVILTGIVLFLPRFILFFVGRSIVADTWIVGWRDLSGLLDPNTNIVTAMLVMQTRNMLKIDLVSWGNILYSLVLACAELALGGLLFVRRHSELAERSARNGRFQTLFACLLALPVMLLVMRSPRKLTIAILLVASLLVYLVYQFTVLRSAKRVLRTLPWYACTVAVAAGLYFGMTGVSNAVLNDTPDASEIRAVTFFGNELDTSNQRYSAVRISEIPFTEDAVKAYVAKSLRAAVERVKQPGYAGERYFKDGAYNTVEPIVITLNNGRKLYRSIEFSDMNELNGARNANPAYAAAIRAFPPRENIDFLVAEYANSTPMSDEDAEKLRATYVSEFAEQDRVSNDYYGEYTVRENSRSRNYTMYLADEDQGIGYFRLAGHIGARRFFDWFSITLETPKTAGLYMMLSNDVVEPDAVYNAAVTLKILRGKLPENGNLHAGCAFTNVPMQNGSKQQINIYHDGNVYDGKYQADASYGASAEQMAEMLEIFGRGTPTADPSVMFAKLSYSTNVRFDGSSQTDNDTVSSAYLAFTKEDEQKLLQLIAEWTAARYAQERIYNPDFDGASVQVG